MEIILLNITCSAEGRVWGAWASDLNVEEKQFINSNCSLTTLHICAVHISSYIFQIVKDKVEFCLCDCIVKEKVWNGSEKVDHVACKYWCVLQGSGVIKIIINLAQSCTQKDVYGTTQMVSGLLNLISLSFYAHYSYIHTYIFHQNCLANDIYL